MENITQKNIKDNMSFKDANKKHGLRGHVQVFTQNIESGETNLHYESDNIIPISGMQWILMKAFGLYLDSNHVKKYEELGRDTNLVMPDLNAKMNIGLDPNNEYIQMDEDISDHHFVQGFMVGNGGSGEDSITTKNTDYSFINLRNPIPFQQNNDSKLDPTLAGKYLGVLRNARDSQFSKNYYIKKFDERPHIYHSWYSEGQSWDYVNPITANDLGPNAINGAPVTDRIETYVQCKMSIDTTNGDCLSYFKYDSNTQTALINELGLVAFDTLAGERSILENLYTDYIKDLIKIVFNNSRTDEDCDKLIDIASFVKQVFTEDDITSYGQSNISNFATLVNTIATTPKENADFDAWQDTMSSESNINVEALYNKNGEFVMETDNFLELLKSDEFATLSIDEAERIKLITYYTFKSIPLQTNWKILINYRIYAN